MTNLIRIDDRLIHGQVVVGWASHLNPDYIILIDDDIAADEMDSELYLMGVPPEYEGRCLSIQEGADFINSISADTKFIIVVRSPEVAFKLYKTEFHYQQLNIGGMHSNAGKDEFNRYIYTDSSDLDYLNSLYQCGVQIEIQDLPTEKKYSIEKLLKTRDH